MQKTIILLLLTFLVSCDKTKTSTNSALAILLSAFGQSNQNSTQVTASGGAIIPVTGTPATSQPTSGNSNVPVSDPNNPDPLLRVNLTIPAGALDEDTNITYNSTELPAAKNGIVPFQAAYSFGPEGTQFNTPANLEICYNPQELASKNLSEKTVQIQYYNPDTKEFVSMGGEVDTRRHCVTSPIYHFSTYLLAAQAALPGNNPPTVGGASFFPGRPIEGLPVTVRSNITDFDANSNSIAGANIYYRRAGSASAYTKMALNPDFLDATGQFYMAVIPGADVFSNGIQYYLEATDSLGATRTTTPTTIAGQAARTTAAIRLNTTITRMTAGFSRDLTLQVRGLGVGTWFPVPPTTTSFVNGTRIRATLTSTRFTAQGGTSGTIQGTYGSLSTSQTFVIQPGPLQAVQIFYSNVDVTNTTLDFISQQTYTFDVRGNDQFGNFVSVFPTFAVTNAIGTIAGSGPTIGQFVASLTGTTLTGTLQAAVGNQSASVNIRVFPVPPSLLTYTGSPFSFPQNVAITTITPTVSGIVTSCSSSPALPAGLSIDNTSCAISGTPTTEQPSTSYVITASNDGGSTTASISIAISAAPTALTYANSPFAFPQNVAITTITPTFTGTVTSCTSSPALHTGLSIDNTTCAISGTPTTWQAASNYTITASNVSGNTTATISIAVTSDGSTWTARTLPSSQSWNSVAYGNGVFVAISGSHIGSNVAATSPDGTAWTARTLPSSSNWRSITFGNGLFVAVGHGVVAATSADGITWTARTLPISSNWSSVTYGNGAFVAVGSGTSVATSADGINWTLGTLPFFQFSWTSVTFGNGVFVAVSIFQSNKAAISADGIIWTPTTLSDSTNWLSVTFGNGVFVAVANSISFQATSPDGITWTTRTTQGPNWRAVTFGNGIFVALSNSMVAATSIDGITWTNRPLPNDYSWSAITFGNGVFVAVAPEISNMPSGVVTSP